MGRRILAGVLENTRVLFLELFDLFAGFGEDLLPRGCTWNDFVLNPNARRRLLKLSPYPRLQVEQIVQPLVRKEAAHVHVAMGATDAVDASMALHQAHRVPGQIVVDNIARLLKVHTFSQNIGRDQNIVEVFIPSGWCLARFWGETEDRFFARDAILGLVADYRNNSASISSEPTIGFEHLLKMLHNPLNGIREIRKDYYLAFVANVLIVEPLSARLLLDLN